MKLRAEQLFLLSLVGASIGGIGLLLGVGNLAITLPALALMGISFGPIYPTMLSVVANLFPLAAGRAASLVMAVSGAGGILIPWLLGVLIEGQGAWSFALAAAVGALIMLALYGVVVLLTRRRSPVANAPQLPSPTYNE
jgi:fucose permease